MLLHYRVGDYSQAEQEMIAEMWIDDLRDIKTETGEIFPLPIDLIIQGFKAHRCCPNDSKFKPMAGQIIGQIKSSAMYRLRLAKRAREVLDYLK